MNKHIHWLNQQLPSWIDQGIIEPGQAERIRDLYPQQDGLTLGRLLLTGLGAILIGLGVILLVAYNWDEMSKGLKLAIVFGAFGSAHALGILSMQRNPVLSESLLALGTMLMGAAIFLVAQIYHLDRHYPDAFVMWSAGALALAWVRPSLTQAFIAVILINIWHLSEVVDFGNPHHQGLIVVLLGILPLTWRLRSPMLGRLISASLFLTLGSTIGVEDKGAISYLLLALAAALILLQQLSCSWNRNDLADIAAEVAQPAWLVLVGLMFLFSFVDIFEDINVYWPILPINSWLMGSLLTISQLGFIVLAVRRQLNRVSLLVEASLLLAALPTATSLLSTADTVDYLLAPISYAFNLILLGLSLWMMVQGVRHARRAQLVWGAVIFSALAISRYFDLFDSLVSRSLVFLTVGITLFVAGHFYQRNKKSQQEVSA